MVQQQVIIPQTVYMHYETTNSSFIDMHRYLKAINIKNNNFFLVLYDRGLAGVDPRDPTLSYPMKMRVFRECCANYWYFIREVVRIPAEGAGGAGVRYAMHRGNLAMNFLFTLNYSMYVILPRQNFKSVSTLVRYLWVFNFGASYTLMGFFHKDHGGSKSNLKKLKELRDALPSYLQMSAETSKKTGEKLKVPNTVIALGHKINGNNIVTYPSARSVDQADKLGRGATVAILYFDEFAFMPYNDTVYAAAMPAYSKAADNAKSFNSPYGVCVTTTPGDLISDEGKFAHKLKQDSIPWAEHYYDLNYAQLEELRKSNTNNPFFLVEYSYQQLGRGEEYFTEMVILLAQNWSKIRREILLEWTVVSENGAFAKEDLDKIKQYCRDPIRTLFFGRSMQYQFQVYEDIDLRWPPIVGVDVAGANYNDSSCITVVDSRTTKVCACLNCNYMPGDDLADVLYTLATHYMPNCVINPERNGVPFIY